MVELLKSLIFWVAMAYLFVLATNALYNISPIGRDETDKPGWGSGRSGVRLVTDQETGCQYLETKSGGITPRLDAEGKIICVLGDRK